MREGVTWRAMPHDLPDDRTVYHYFSRWRDDGAWQAIHDALREDVRTAAGRAVSPSAAILDAQSVKTVEQPATCRGFDSGEKVKGRKRHIAVDTLGLLLVIAVTAADVGDRTGARLLAGGLRRERFPRLLTLFADAGDSGQPSSSSDLRKPQIWTSNPRQIWAVTRLLRPDFVWLKAPKRMSTTKCDCSTNAGFPALGDCRSVRRRGRTSESRATPGHPDLA